MPATKLTLADLAVRLDRLEALLDRFGGGIVSDPAPDDWGRRPAVTARSGTSTASTGTSRGRPILSIPRRST